MDTKKIKDQFRETYEYVGESSPYDDDLNPKVVSCDRLEELFEAKRVMHQYDAPNMGLTPNADFEVRISVTNDDGVVLFKESIDTYMPLFASEAEDGGVNYKSMAKVMTEGDNLSSVENVFDFLRMKKENNVNVSLQMEVVDKDFGIVIFNNDIDKVEFMKAAVDAKKKIDNSESLKTIGKSVLAIAAVYSMLNTGVLDNSLIEGAKDVWQNVIGNNMSNANDFIKRSIEIFSQGHLGETTKGTELLKSSFSAVTDIIEIFTKSPIATVGGALGLSTFNSAKSIFNSFSENDLKHERINELYNVNNENSDKTIQTFKDEYRPLMNI